MITELWSSVIRNRARTRADHPDPYLRGRVYPVPFPKVWGAVGAEASTRSGWSITGTDPRAGTLRAEVRTRKLKHTHDVRVEMSLDENGFTRVDVESSSRKGFADLGANARRIRRFLEALDARLLED